MDLNVVKRKPVGWNVMGREGMGAIGRRKDRRGREMKYLSRLQHPRLKRRHDFGCDSLLHIRLFWFLLV
jgi:hypothetical protein